MLCLVVALITLTTNCYGKVDHAVYIQPEQIHLSLGASYDQMVVTWVTFNQTTDSTVWFGQKRMDNVAYGTQTFFQDSGSEKRSMYIHRVYLEDLKVSSSPLAYI